VLDAGQLGFGVFGQVGQPVTAGRPAPRSIRAGNVSASSRAPVAALIRLAARSPRSVSALPPSKSNGRGDSRSATTAT
jgi:hypothetical protein